MGIEHSIQQILMLCSLMNTQLRVLICGPAVVPGFLSCRCTGISPLSFELLFSLLFSQHFLTEIFVFVLSLALSTCLLKGLCSQYFLFLSDDAVISTHFLSVRLHS